MQGYPSAADNQRHQVQCHSISPAEAARGGVNDPAIDAVIAADANFGHWSVSTENGRVNSSCAPDTSVNQPESVGDAMRNDNDDARNDGSRNDTVRNLPAFTAATPTNFRWGSKEGHQFAEHIHKAYEEVIHWRRNVFLLPSGNVGKEFVRELTRLFHGYAQRSALESVALDSITVACLLLLQKPHVTSKSREHVAALERRLRAWHEGDIEGLLREGRTIQHSLPKYAAKEFTEDREEKLARTFSRLVLTGRIHAAIRYLSENERSNGVLPLDELCGTQTVRQVLGEKHPSARTVNPQAVLSPGEVNSVEVHPVLFDQITGDSIRASAMRTQGSAGPSGVDAAGWRRILVSFHRDSRDLCAAIAAFTRRICTEYVEPTSLQAFLACRLIPINKNPGVRPIGVCEVLRRIVGKVIMKVVGNDVLQATGPIQLCSGQEAGAEAAVHAMRTLFEQEGTDAVMLVDATNAFNNLNRKVALLNISLLCPAIATVLINCYRGNAQLLVNGEIILSQEGTTQGDPLAMAMFALASMPLIRKVITNGAKQAWFADDAALGGKLTSIRQWWDQLIIHGPRYGYFPHAGKTVVITKGESYEAAVTLFEDTGVTISDTGQRYLGGGIGGEAFLEGFARRKISEWVMEVEQLSAFAKSQPHAAFAAFQYGLVPPWTYLNHVLPVSTDLLQPLENAIRQTLLPVLTGQPAFNDQMRDLVALPPRHGGLGLINPLTLPQTQQQSSVSVCRPLVKAILDQEGDPLAVRMQQRQLRKEEQQQRRRTLKEDSATLRRQPPANLQRSADAASEKGASAWLTTLPIEGHGFSLHKGAFRDAVALRYGWPLPFCPEKCICGAKFETEHQLTCRQGGFVSLRHNELRDLTASLMKEVCCDVATEPSLQRVTGELLPRSANKSDGARLDVRARGFWGSNMQEAFFDIRVFHPHASSYRNTPLTSLYRQHEAKKKSEYGERVRQIEHGCFTPIIFSTTGGMGNEAQVVFKRLASMISDRSGEPYSTVIRWIRSKISFSLLRSALICLRGSRSSPRPNNDICIALASAEGRIC